MSKRKKIYILIWGLLFNLLFASIDPWSGAKSSEPRLSEQELALEKFLANLETALANKFYDYRQRPVIRAAIFDFTDGAGNIPKSGREIAEKIARRLYQQKQFAVLSKEKIDKYLKWMGMSALSKINAQMLWRWQRRINTLDPGHGIHVLIGGEIQKGVGRSMRLSAYLINFLTDLGPVEIEKNILDMITINAEVPLPTEQALKEAFEIVVRGEVRPSEEGRLLILAGNKGQNLVATDYLHMLKKDKPFPWAKVPLIIMPGKEDGIVPENVKIGLDHLLLTPLSGSKEAGKEVEYSFLHGKCSTNLVYFDEIVPARSYRLIAALTDPKSYESRSLTEEIQVYPGTTTLVVLSFYIPSEKERIRSKQSAQIKIFQIWGKGLEFFPEKW